MAIIRELHQLKNQRAEKLTAAQDALKAKNMEGYSAIMGEVTAMNTEVEAMEALLAEEGRFAEGDRKLLNLAQVAETEKADSKLRNAVDAARSGNEYVHAFAAALKNGATPSTMGGDIYAPLRNALTISGGNPEGSDGGFLVPVEFDNMIHRKMKEFVRLADYANVENVTANSGWRAVETSASRKSLLELNEAQASELENDKPRFATVNYKMRSFGDFILVSNELMADNTAGLLQYLAEWFAPRVVMTENSLILALTNKLTVQNFTAGKEVRELKGLLNRSLNTAISKNAIILTNGNGYDYFDNLEDKNGRPMLVPNPADPDVYRFKGRPVVAADIDLIPSRTVTTTGATKGDYDPVFVGCLRAFATLFQRQALEFTSTNVGGSAWRANGNEVRGIVRMDAQAVDTDAMIRREIFTPAT